MDTPEYRHIATIWHWTKTPDNARCTTTDAPDNTRWTHLDEKGPLETRGEKASERGDEGGEDAHDQGVNHEGEVGDGGREREGAGKGVEPRGKGEGGPLEHAVGRADKALVGER